MRCHCVSFLFSHRKNRAINYGAAAHIFFPLCLWAKVIENLLKSCSILYHLTDISGKKRKKRKYIIFEWDWFRIKHAFKLERLTYSFYNFSKAIPEITSLSFGKCVCFFLYGTDTCLRLSRSINYLDERQTIDIWFQHVYSEEYTPNLISIETNFVYNSMRKCFVRRELTAN